MHADVTSVGTSTINISRRRIQKKSWRKNAAEGDTCLVRELKLSAGVECRLDLLGFISTPTLHCFMSHHCQPWKLTFYGLGKEEELMTWWGSVISRVPWQWRRVFSSSRLSQPTPPLLPPTSRLYISFCSETRRKKGSGCLIADWIWFWRNTITSGSNLFSRLRTLYHLRAQPKWCSARITEAAGGRLSESFPLAKHEGPNRQLVLHRMSVMVCPNSKSVDLLTTIAHRKSLLLWLEEDIFSFLLISCVFFSPYCFLCVFYIIVYVRAS